MIRNITYLWRKLQGYHFDTARSLVKISYFKVGQTAKNSSSITYCVTLGKLFNLSESLAPPFEMEITI